MEIQPAMRATRFIATQVDTACMCSLQAYDHDTLSIVI
jgi:hypothetical protein